MFVSRLQERKIVKNVNEKEKNEYILQVLTTWPPCASAVRATQPPPVIKYDATREVVHIHLWDFGLSAMKWDDWSWERPPQCSASSPLAFDL